RRISSSPLYDVKSWSTNSTGNFPLIIRRRLATLKRIRGASCVWGVTWGCPPLRAHRGLSVSRRSTLSHSKVIFGLGLGRVGGPRVDGRNARGRRASGGWG